MKTTIDIADNIFLATREMAKENDTTFRELVIRGLSLVLGERKKAKPFRLKPVTFNGKGLTPEMQNADWSSIRDTAYRL